MVGKSRTPVYTTGKANKTKNDSYFNCLNRMNDDVIVTVPVNGTYFTVENSKGKKKLTFEIKQKKNQPIECKKLEK